MENEAFSYAKLSSRHQGLISPEEQERLRRSRVAIAGLGGVGGVHLITLTRTGIGGFRIADPDRFEVANFNRQYGANMRTIGRNKAEVMAEEARAINPELELSVFPEAITSSNVDHFLDGADIFLDGIDAFALETRRLLFREARRRRIWAITAGPLGFSTICIVFAPDGISFDEYFDLDDAMDPLDQLVAFVVGLAPGATHATYMDLTQVDPQSGRAPSSGLACQLCAGMAAAQVVKILLNRGPIRPAPWYFQFDAYRLLFRAGRLRRGNRQLLQRLKRRRLRDWAVQVGWRAPS